MARHIRKGDMVMVTSGDHKGKVGEVMRVITKTDRVVIKGVNLRTKTLKPSPKAPQGGMITREQSLPACKVSPVVDGKATRVRFKVNPDGSKIRVAARGGKTLGVVHGPREARKS
jgi:large subunit ribosomal protein L24